MLFCTVAGWVEPSQLKTRQCEPSILPKDGSNLFTKTSMSEGYPLQDFRLAEVNVTQSAPAHKDH